MRCPHCKYENANAAAVCAECLRPLELPPLQDRLLHEPPQPRTRPPSVSTTVTRAMPTILVVAPSWRGGVSSPLPKINEPRATHRSAPSMRAAPAPIPRLPRARAPVSAPPDAAELAAALAAVRGRALREPAEPPGRGPSVAAQAIRESQGPRALAPTIRAPVSPPLPALVKPEAVSRSAPWPVTRPARIPPLPRARPIPKPAPALVKPALHEQAALPPRVPAMAARAFRETHQPAAFAQRRMELRSTELPRIIRPAAGMALPPSPAARPAPLPTLPRAPVPDTGPDRAEQLRRLADRALQEPTAPVARLPSVPAAAGQPTDAAPLGAASAPAVVPGPLPEVLGAALARPLESVPRGRPAALPHLPPAPTPTAPLPTPLPAVVSAPGMRLYPPLPIVLLCVILLPLVGIAAYYASKRFAPAARSSAASSARMAPTAMIPDQGDDAYVMAVQDIWGKAMVAFQRFGSATSEGNLRDIAEVACELRIELDVLGLDAYDVEPPTDMASAHKSLLAALDHFSLVFERAETLASNPLDEGAAGRSAELLSAAAQQARSADAALRAEIDELEPLLSVEVWTHVNAVGEMAKEARRSALGSARSPAPQGERTTDSRE